MKKIFSSVAALMVVSALFLACDFSDADVTTTGNNSSEDDTVTNDNVSPIFDKDEIVLFNAAQLTETPPGNFTLPNGTKWTIAQATLDKNNKNMHEGFDYVEVRDNHLYSTRTKHVSKYSICKAELNKLKNDPEDLLQYYKNSYNKWSYDEDKMLMILTYDPYPTDRISPFRHDGLSNEFLGWSGDGYTARKTNSDKSKYYFKAGDTVVYFLKTE